MPITEIQDVRVVPVEYPAIDEVPRPVRVKVTRERPKRRGKFIFVGRQKV